VNLVVVRQPGWELAQHGFGVRDGLEIGCDNGERVRVA
jgi:hypothetical protein